MDPYDTFFLGFLSCCMVVAGFVGCHLWHSHRQRVALDKKMFVDPDVKQ